MESSLVTLAPHWGFRAARSTKQTLGLSSPLLGGLFCLLGRPSGGLGHRGLADEAAVDADQRALLLGRQPVIRADRALDIARAALGRLVDEACAREESLATDLQC